MKLEEQVKEIPITKSPEEFLLLPYAEKVRHPKEWVKAYFIFWMNNLNPLNYEN